MTCPNCFSNDVTKNGHTYYGEQNHICKKCGRNFIAGTNQKNLSEETLKTIERALLERNSLRGICRIFDISLGWLLSFIDKIYKELPDNLNIDLCKIMKSILKFDIVICEADELWSFVGNKDNKKWVWLMIDRASRQIIAFHVGGRTKGDALKLWKNVPEILRNHCFVFTDFLESYTAVLPQNQHKSVGKETGETAHIERLNGTFRQRISRLVRKTLSFSKKVHNHIRAIKHFICDYNQNIVHRTRTA